MKSVVEACLPRKDILEGTFNPEIFTAGLSQVMDFYRGKNSVLHNIYTDAGQFFSEGTYPTEGLRLVLTDVFSRLSGRGAPAIHRLETAFGGGKTHILIALAHLGFRGTDLAPVASAFMGPQLLLPPGEVRVVGVAGDEIPLHKPKGTRLVPYTLWGEIAYQVGGEGLYRQVEDEAVSHAAPSRDFLDQVLSGRKVIIMLDELAQYATRLEAAHPHGGEQLGAFIMALNGYARSRTGISVVFTLASRMDAFARQTEILTQLISEVRGEDVSQEDALAIAQRAEASSRSVASRDSTSVVPVRAGEISRVLARRLFESIDQEAAREAAEAYMDMYARSGSSLPERALRTDFRDVLVAHYPFHPTFIDFLNQKLATLETFQGTRGVLRVLAFTLRALWKKAPRLPMIHSSHVDLRESRILDEIIGRTGSGDLLPIVNADLGGPDTSRLEGGYSQAELADRKNRHPSGYPFHEYAWKTVFLHSLVGRSRGVGSNLFGITEKDALFEVSFPELTPPQVETALKEIMDNAYYLRFEQGRYFASLDPSINIVLAQIRKTIQREQAWEMIRATARKTVTGAAGSFKVIHDVSLPEHIPDHSPQPILAMIALDSKTIDPMEFLTTTGPNRPRIQQNQVILFVPGTVHVKGEIWNEDRARRRTERVNHLLDLACWVIAMRRLSEKPENYGIHPARLDKAEFKTRKNERELALQTNVVQMYETLWYPSASGKMMHKEIKTGGGEGGFSVLEEIRRILLAEGELITAEKAPTTEVLQALAPLFFEEEQTPVLKNLKENFHSRRNWPLLEQASLFETIVREGVPKGCWCLFLMENEQSIKPDVIHTGEGGGVPLDADLDGKPWRLVTLQGARQRGWNDEKVDTGKLEKVVLDKVADNGGILVADLLQNVRNDFQSVPTDDVRSTIEKAVRAGKLMVYSGDQTQEEKPDYLISGNDAMSCKLEDNDVLTTPAEAARRGWLGTADKKIVLSGTRGADVLLPLLKRPSDLFKDGKSMIDSLEISGLELPDGGLLNVSLENASPQSMKKLGEFWETLDNAVQRGSETTVFLEVADPHEGCSFVQAIRKKDKEG